MQRYQIIGRIGKDLEIRKTQAGKSVLEFSVADTKKINDNEALTTWATWVAWEGKADAIARYSRKGDMIYLEGEYRNEQYKDKEGNNRYKNYFIVNSFQFLPNKREEQQPKEHASMFGNGPDVSALNIEPEDLPFY